MFKFDKKFLRILVPLGILALGIVIFIILKGTGPAVEAEPSAEKIWPISAIRVSKEDFQPKIIEYGSIVAGNQADLRSLVSGRIVNVGERLFEGAIINEGDLIVGIDRHDYELELVDRKAAVTEVLTRISETKAELVSEIKLLSISKSQLSLRKKDMNRRQKLVKQGTTSRKSVDDSVIAFNEASKAATLRNQTIIRLKNRLKQHQASAKRAQSAYSLAKRNLEETRLLAPFNGFLANVDASIGQYVRSTDRLARLIQSDRLEVSFRLSESDFGGLLDNMNGADQNKVSVPDGLIGRKIEVTWKVGKKNLSFEAIIERLGAEIDSTSGGIDIFARLLGLNFTTPLRPGAFVAVGIPGRIYNDVIKIPRSALLDNKYLFIIREGRLKRLNVEIAQLGPDWVLISDDKLDGELVAVKPFPEMAEGLKVESR